MFMNNNFFLNFFYLLYNKIKYKIIFYLIKNKYWLFFRDKFLYKLILYIYNEFYYDIKYYKLNLKKFIIYLNENYIGIFLYILNRICFYILFLYFSILQLIENFFLDLEKFKSIYFWLKLVNWYNYYLFFKNIKKFIEVFFLVFSFEIKTFYFKYIYDFDIWFYIYFFFRLPFKFFIKNPFRIYIFVPLKWWWFVGRRTKRLYRIYKTQLLEDLFEYYFLILFYFRLLQKIKIFYFLGFSIKNSIISRLKFILFFFLIIFKTIFNSIFNSIFIFLYISLEIFDECYEFVLDFLFVFLWKIWIFFKFFFLKINYSRFGRIYRFYCRSIYGRIYLPVEKQIEKDIFRDLENLTESSSREPDDWLDSFLDELFFSYYLFGGYILLHFKKFICFIYYILEILNYYFNTYFYVLTLELFYNLFNINFFLVQIIFKLLIFIFIILGICIYFKNKNYLDNKW